MSEQSRFPRSVLGAGFAQRFVAGMVADPSAVPGVLEALSRAGFGRDAVRVLPGEWALAIDASHHPSMVPGPCVPGEEEASQEFVADALLGDVLLGVGVWSDARARAAARVLLREGVTCVHHFGSESVGRPPEPVGSSA